MGSLSLMCPMCCGESFANSESLKDHLLSMTNNLSCPSCSVKTYSVTALIQHLDCCEKKVEEDIQIKLIENDSINDFESNSNNEDGTDILMNDSDENFYVNVNEEGIMTVSEGRTIQVDENGDIHVVEKKETENKKNLANLNKTRRKKSQLKSLKKIHNTSKELTSNVKIETLEFSDDDIEKFDASEEMENFEDQSILKESETVYSCSTCGMNFTSVIEHIKEYHDGQEVLLDIDDVKMDELESETVIPSTTVESLTTEQSNQITKNSNKKRHNKNTLQTEECIDSDGRLYTRKVVQIEKFWDQSPSMQLTSKPMIEKFFSNVEGVKVRGKYKNTKPASSRIHKCDQCLKQFNKLGELRTHACAQGSSRCDFCDQTFASIKALQAHCLKTHEGIDMLKMFTCTICSTEFSSHKSLALHARMHAPVKSRRVNAPEGTEEETFVCEECGKTLSESYRTAHMALHAGEIITCLICNRKFDSEESLKMHAAVHGDASTTNASGVRDFLVPITSQNIRDAEFINSETTPSTSLMSDSTAETSINDNINSAANILTQESTDLHSLKPYQCQHCGRRFSRPHEKVKHERIHTGEKPHSCEVCGKKFRVSYCLTLHMRTHTGERPYECQHCGKRFKASSVYNHHLLTHGDERAYTCPYCPKTFKTRVQLAGHKNSHTKPFKCTECSRPFASLYAARAHMQTHKKDNNLKFNCNICGATYGRAFALKDHMKLHAKENDLLLPPDPSGEEEIMEVENFTLTEEVVGEELIVPDDLYPKLEKVEE